MKFPEHKGALELEHNQHKNGYQTVAKWWAYLESWEGGIAIPEWESQESKRRSMETNEIWTLHWYPETPIGFNYVAAPTLEELLNFANKYGK